MFEDNLNWEQRRKSIGDLAAKLLDVIPHKEGKDSRIELLPSGVFVVSNNPDSFFVQPRRLVLDSDFRFFPIPTHIKSFLYGFRLSRAEQDLTPAPGEPVHYPLVPGKGGEIVDREYYFPIRGLRSRSHNRADFLAYLEQSWEKSVSDGVRSTVIL